MTYVGVGSDFGDRYGVPDEEGARLLRIGRLRSDDESGSFEDTTTDIIVANVLCSRLRGLVRARDADGETLFVQCFKNTNLLWMRTSLALGPRAAIVLRSAESAAIQQDRCNLTPPYADVIHAWIPKRCYNSDFDRSSK